MLNLEKYFDRLYKMTKSLTWGEGFIWSSRPRSLTAAREGVGAPIGCWCWSSFVVSKARRWASRTATGFGLQRHTPDLRSETGGGGYRFRRGPALLASSTNNGLRWIACFGEVFHWPSSSRGFWCDDWTGFGNSCRKAGQVIIFDIVDTERARKATRCDVWVILHTFGSCNPLPRLARHKLWNDVI